jgi:hypothetical protein
LALPCGTDSQESGSRLLVAGDRSMCRGKTD